MQDKIKNTIFDKEVRIMLNRIKRMIMYYNIIKEKRRAEG